MLKHIYHMLSTTRYLPRRKWIYPCKNSYLNAHSNIIYSSFPKTGNLNVYLLTGRHQASLWLTRQKNLPSKKETQVKPCVGKFPYRDLLPTPVFLSGKSHGQTSLAGCTVHGVTRVGHNLATKPLPTNMWKNQLVYSYTEILFNNK